MNTAIADFHEFSKDLHLRLEVFKGDAIISVTLYMASSVIDKCFEGLRARNKILLPSDGFQIAKGRSLIKSTALVVRWFSVFFPKGRYACHTYDSEPLGFYEKYDLYIHKAPSGGTYLLARYGSYRGEYHHLKLTKKVIDTMDITMHPPYFQEAFARMQLLNYPLNVL